MRDLRELRFAHAGDNDPHPKLSIDDVHDCERRYGIQLPGPYVSFLSYANGGRLGVNQFKNARGFEASAVSVFFHLTPDQDDPYGLWWNTENLRGILTRGDVRPYREKRTDGNVVFIEEPAVPLDADDLEPTHIGPAVVAIGEDGGGNVLFLDFNSLVPGVSIYWFDEDMVTRLAGSFEEFVDGLY